MIESCASESVCCDYIIPGPYQQSTSRKCGRFAGWRIDGQQFCWQHVGDRLEGREAEIERAGAEEAARREINYQRRLIEAPYGFVYVLQPYGVTPAPLKIGFSGDIESVSSRVMALQIGNWHRLELVCVRAATRPQESDLHRRLRQYWIRGEWFQPHVDVWRAIYATGAGFADAGVGA